MYNIEIKNKTGKKDGVKILATVYQIFSIK
jgi:hypothetical protein